MSLSLLISAPYKPLSSHVIRLLFCFTLQHIAHSSTVWTLLNLIFLNSFLGDASSNVSMPFLDFDGDFNVDRMCIHCPQRRRLSQASSSLDHTIACAQLRRGNSSAFWRSSSPIHRLDHCLCERLHRRVSMRSTTVLSPGLKGKARAEQVSRLLRYWLQLTFIGTETSSNMVY